MTPMKHYEYIGDNILLILATALGQEDDGVFKVQVDEFQHPWSHGWHETPREDWCEMPGEDWSDEREETPCLDP